jgi:hypothetical protein
MENEKGAQSGSGGWGWAPLALGLVIVVSLAALALALLALLTDPTASWRSTNSWGHDVQLDAELEALRVRADEVDADLVAAQSVQTAAVSTGTFQATQAAILPRGVRGTYVRLGAAAQTWTGPNPGSPLGVEARLLPHTVLDASVDAAAVLAYVAPAPALVGLDLTDALFTLSPAAPVGGHVRFLLAGEYRVFWRAVLRGAGASAGDFQAVLVAGPQAELSSNLRKAVQTRLGPLPWLRAATEVQPVLANDVVNPVLEPQEVTIALAASVRVAAGDALAPVVFRAFAGGAFSVLPAESELRVELVGPM